MNQNLLASTIKAILSDNEEDFFEGINLNSVQRGWGFITESDLTPVEGYYACYITVFSPSNKSQEPVSVNSRMPPTKSEYSVKIHMADLAEVELGEENPYETASRQFRTVLNRIANYFTDNDVGSGFKLRRGRTEDRVVEANDLSGSFKDVEGNEFPGLYAEIDFQVEDWCESDTARRE